MNPNTLPPDNPLRGYGPPDGTGSSPRRGCVIDLGDPALRAAAIETGLIWSGPMAAQYAAILDIAKGRIDRPTYALPDWAEYALAWHAEKGRASEVRE